MLQAHHPLPPPLHYLFVPKDMGHCMWSSTSTLHLRSDSKGRSLRLQDWDCKCLYVGPEGAQSFRLLALQTSPQPPLSPTPHNHVHSYPLATCRSSLLHTGSS